jgi:DNA-binding protein HU-beta
MRCEQPNSVYSEQDYFRGSSDTKATQPATAAAPKPKVNTVSLKHLAAEIAETHEMPKKQGEAILGDLVNLITKHLKKGDRIRLVGLGVLQVRKRAARMGRNPATGEPIQIKASKKVAFRASKELKEAV